MAQPNIPFDTTNSTAPTVGANAEDELLPTEAAYVSVLPELTAMPEDDLIAMNLDVMAAVTTVTGALPEIIALRPEIEARLKDFDFAQFDKLKVYALAVTHAHTIYRRSTTPKGNIVEMAAELTTMRDRLLFNAQSLASVGLFDSAELRSVKTVSGYRALAADVLTLVGVFKANRAALEGKTPFSSAELLRVGNLALQLVSAVGLREQTPVVAGEATLLRQKAFTLLLRTYDAARRAVQYVRSPEGDADQIAPSLYAGRASRRPNEPAPAPVASDGAPAAAGSTAAPHASRTPAPPLVIENHAGLPIDAPYTS